MLLAAFFIMGFGMCAGRREALFMPEELNSTQLFKRSLNMVRNQSDLHLLMFSPNISDIPRCLMSKFLMKMKTYTQRTLETSKIVESKEMFSDGELTTLQYNIKIVVNMGNPPSFNVTYEGDPPPEWKKPQNVLYAKPKHCLLLGTSTGQKWSGNCTLWGYTTCKDKCLFDCQKTFVSKCGRGIPVHRTDCTETKVKTDRQGYKPK
uniref:Putative secreted protein 94 n=1 Tax=Amblyomma parvum TaxID=251391 RepID=A0A023G1G5_AMBPA